MNEDDLPAALLRGVWRVVQRSVIALMLAVIGFATGLLILTLGSVAAAWDTTWRWPVLLGVAGLYLVIGGVGAWMIARPIDDPDLQAVQQRVGKFTDALAGEGSETPTFAGIKPRSRTLQWVAALGALPIPWLRVAQSVLLWRSMRRRR